MKHAILVVIIFDKPAEDILLYVLCTFHLHLGLYLQLHGTCCFLLQE